MRTTVVCTLLLLLSSAATATPQEAQPASQPLKPEHVDDKDLPKRNLAGVQLVDPGEYSKLPVAPVPAGAAGLPDKIDLSAMFPAPGDQGDQASCVGWATAYALTHKQYVEHGPAWDLGKKTHLFSPAYIYNMARNNAANPNCNTGALVPNAASLMYSGVATWQVFPYDAKKCDLPSPAVRALATQYKIASFGKVEPRDHRELRWRIAAGEPIIVVMRADEFFAYHLSGKSVYQGLSPNSRQLFYHALLLIGYDESIAAFKVLNSFGSKWGDGGYGYISYTAADTLIQEAYIVGVAHSVGAAKPYALSITTTRYADQTFGAITRELVTGNHHCEFNCQGEPTRTKYTLDVQAHEGNLLRSPVLTCVEGPCHGWHTIYFARPEKGDTKATAEWDVWSSPTKWRLVAEEYRRVKVSEKTTVVEPGTFEVTASITEPPPELQVLTPEGVTLAFTAGDRPVTDAIVYAGQRRDADAVIYTYTIPRP